MKKQICFLCKKKQKHVVLCFIYLKLDVFLDSNESVFIYHVMPLKGLEMNRYGEIIDIIKET